MFDLALSEIILIALVALVFLGPKELVSLMKSIGKIAGKAQRYGQHFKMMVEHDMYHEEKDDDKKSG